MTVYNKITSLVLVIHDLKVFAFDSSTLIFRINALFLLIDVALISFAW